MDEYVGGRRGVIYTSTLGPLTDLLTHQGRIFLLKFDFFPPLIFFAEFSFP